MIRVIFFLCVFLIFSPDVSQAQAYLKTSDLFRRQEDYSRTGRLNINQDPRVDSLLSRYIIANRRIKTSDGNQGMGGFRIQIYSNSIRSAREESARAKAKFLSSFPDIPSYAQYQDPGYFMIRVGDYRTKTEGFKDLMMIREVFPDAYIVPDVINFPDVKKR